MCTHFFVYIIENTCFELFQFCLGILRCKGIGIVCFHYCPIVISNQKRIGSLILPRYENCKKSRLVLLLHRILFSSGCYLHCHSLCIGNECLNQKSRICHMRPQKASRLRGLWINNLFNPCPIHHIIQNLIHEAPPSHWTKPFEVPPSDNQSTRKNKKAPNSYNPSCYHFFKFYYTWFSAT